MFSDGLNYALRDRCLVLSSIERTSERCCSEGDVVEAFVVKIPVDDIQSATGIPGPFDLSSTDEEELLDALLHRNVNEGYHGFMALDVGRWGKEIDRLDGTILEGSLEGGRVVPIQLCGLEAFWYVLAGTRCKDNLSTCVFQKTSKTGSDLAAAACDENGHADVKCKRGG
jgi:hypothetical protein